jgi:hypothetical protein
MFVTFVEDCNRIIEVPSYIEERIKSQKIAWDFLILYLIHLKKNILYG